ncbi:unnamed protein product, partial [Rotaria sp. Silwood2]
FRSFPVTELYATVAI